MALDLTALAAELANDPKALGYAPHVASRDDAGLAAMLNAPRGTRAISRLCNERTIMSFYADGALAADALLTAIETYAAGTQPLSSITRRAMRYVQQPDGLDLGSPTTVMMLGALVQAGVITADQSAKLTAIATDPSSRALDLFGVPVAAHDVTVALNGA